MKRRAQAASKLARITTQLLDRHTIEFGPGVDLDVPRARSWRELQIAFLVDRYGSSAVVVVSRCGTADGCDIQIARHRRASRAFFVKLVDSADYRADGACVIDGAIDHAIDDDLRTLARQWFDSRQTTENNLIVRRDGVYPVMGATALRYTNVLRNARDLQVDIDRVVARVGKGS